MAPGRLDDTVFAPLIGAKLWRIFFYNNCFLKMALLPNLFWKRRRVIQLFAEVALRKGAQIMY